MVKAEEKLSLLLNFTLNKPVIQCLLAIINFLQWLFMIKKRAIGLFIFYKDGKVALDWELAM